MSRFATTADIDEMSAFFLGHLRRPCCDKSLGRDLPKSSTDWKFLFLKDELCAPPPLVDGPDIAIDQAT